MWWPFTWATPQRPCRLAAAGAAAGAPLAKGTVSPGMAGTVMPPMVTQPLLAVGAADGAGAACAAVSGGAVRPGIEGSTKPPKFTHPAGAATVANELTRVGAAKGGGAGAVIRGAGAGGCTGAPKPPEGARALVGEQATASAPSTNPSDKRDAVARFLKCDSLANASVVRPRQACGDTNGHLGGVETHVQCSRFPRIPCSRSRRAPRVEMGEAGAALEYVCAQT